VNHIMHPGEHTRKITEIRSGQSGATHRPLPRHIVDRVIVSRATELAALPADAR